MECDEIVDVAVSERDRLVLVTAWEPSLETTLAAELQRRK